MHDPTQAPVFIGGTNGSGTRVYAELLDAAGVFQGTQKNHAFEPANIIQYTRPLVPELMEQTGAAVYDLETVPPQESQLTENWLRDFASQVQAEKPSSYPRWGWKHPRNLFLAPFLNVVFPASFFVQVIRDGRDMALAGNKGDFQTISARFTDDFPNTPAGAARFWSQMNTSVAQWSAAHFGPRFVWSRFEDLCADPEQETRRILKALGLDFTPAVETKCGDFVRRPDTVGRWRNLPEAEQAEVNAAADPGLRYFGYR